MAAQVGIAPSSVHNIWKAHGLKPHLVETFKLSRDPDFVAKLHPDPRDTGFFLTTTDPYERIVYVPCADCDGSGVEVGPAYLTGDDSGIHAECATPEHHPATGQKWIPGGFWVEETTLPCCRCKGHCVTPHWTAQLVTLDTLLTEARS